MMAVKRSPPWANTWMSASGSPSTMSNIGVTSGLNLAEFRFHQDLGVHRGGGTQDSGRRLDLAPDREFTGLMNVQMTQKIRAEAQVEALAIHDFKSAQRAIAHFPELGARPRRQQA